MAGNTMLSAHEEVIRLARWLVLGQQLQNDWYSLQRHQRQDLLLLPQKLLQLPKQVNLANTISASVVLLKYWSYENFFLLGLLFKQMSYIN